MAQGEPRKVLGLMFRVLILWLIGVSDTFTATWTRISKEWFSTPCGVHAIEAVLRAKQMELLLSMSSNNMRMVYDVGYVTRLSKRTG